MGVFKFLALCAGAFVCLSNYADTYRRGDSRCDGFSEAKEIYHSKPDNKYAQADYGLCLIMARQDEEGIAHLRSAGEKGSIRAVALLARHYRSGGTWNPEDLDFNNIQKTIDLYLQITQMIDNYHGYPVGGASVAEEDYSLEMQAHYRVTDLYYNKFVRGAIGEENFRLNGDQESEEKGKEAYPEYREYTADSLQKVIHYADICLDVPLKRYFNERRYHYYHSACRILKTAAEDILKPYLDADENILNREGLNAERHRLINDETCALDLDNCAPYNKVTEKINNINNRVNAQLSRL